MAKRTVCDNPALKKIEEQLICAICQDLCTKPKILPNCFHSFCQQCLEGLPQDPQGDNYFISCPICRHHTQLPEPTGVPGFPAAFQKALLTSGSQLLSEEQGIKCHSHNEMLDIFCEKCEEVICHDCVKHMHKDHEYHPIISCYPKHYHMLEADLKGVSSNVAAVEGVLVALSDRENEIRAQGEVVKGEIHVTVKEIVDALHQCERQLTKEVDTVSGRKLQVLSEQKKSAEIKLAQLKECQEIVEKSLKIGNPQRVVTSKKQMMERMKNVTQGVNIEELTPIEKVDIHFNFNKDIDVNALGNIVCLQQCKVKKIDSNCVTITKDKAVSFPLSIQLSDSSLLRVPLSSLSCSIVPAGRATPITTTITTTTHPGVYTIQCSTVSRGHHQVNVQVNNVQIDSTSFVIPFNPYVDSIIPTHTITDLKRPYAVVAANDGHLIVSEKDEHCLTILDQNKKKVKSLGKKGNFCHRGIELKMLSS